VGKWGRKKQNGGMGLEAVTGLRAVDVTEIYLSQTFGAGTFALM
jgi:hypothetical protein